VWLAMTLYDSAAASSSDGAVLILRLPQFSDALNSTTGRVLPTVPSPSAGPLPTTLPAPATNTVLVYPPAVPPTMRNPAGISNTGIVAACSWNRFWNANTSSCEWLPMDVPFLGLLPADVASLQVRARHQKRGVIFVGSTSRVRLGGDFLLHNKLILFSCHSKRTCACRCDGETLPLLSCHF
jgi:hypothetical protein